MHHVIFEVLPTADGREPYLAIAARLRPLMEASGGCLALERFDRDDGSGWMLSMQRWADETALERWRAQGDHCAAQRAGRERLFADYRLRVATRLGHRATRAMPVAPEAATAPVHDLHANLQPDGKRAVAILEWTGDAASAPALADVLARAPAESRGYTAILDRDRHALVTPNTTAEDSASPSALMHWCRQAADRFTAAGRPFVLSVAAVDRDYGRFERAEAPVALA